MHHSRYAAPAAEAGAVRRVPADWPVPLEPVTLEGSLVRLEPLVVIPASDTLEQLAAAASDAAVGEHLSADIGSPGAVETYVADLLRQWHAGSALPFLARLRSGGGGKGSRVVGVTRLKEAERAHRRLATSSWFARQVWGTGVNTEAKGLLLAHAFDRLGALRVEFETDSRNTRSRAALAALGAVEEGVLRARRITRDGRRRDSVLLSVIAEEWPTVRARIAERLSRQRQPSESG